MTSLELYLIGGASLLILSVIASKATGRIGVPSLLVFLAIGMIAGSEGLGGIHFDNAQHAQNLGVVALIYILFAGGLDTDINHIRPVLRSGLMLATVGTLVTCVLTASFATMALHFSWLEGLLLGAVVSSTDAAAVFAVLRGRGVHLQEGVQPLLELESGANDPTAVLLTVGILQLMAHPDYSAWMLLPEFLKEMSVGAAIGFFSARGMAWVLNRLKLESEGLYPVVTLALVALVYGSAQAAGGSGFLAVYLAGLLLGDQTFIHKKSLMHFHGGIAWLMQIAIFLALGLLVFPSRLITIAGQGLLISAFLILIARPVAVHLSLVRSGFDPRQKLMIAWTGLRGSVPVILATYALLAGIPKADHIFNLVFFIVITSVVLQGSSIPWVARRLRVEAPHREKFRYPLEYVPNADMHNDLQPIVIGGDSTVVGKSVLELRLPKEALIALIQRRGKVIVPRGGTHLEAGDTLLVLADRQVFADVRGLLG